MKSRAIQIAEKVISVGASALLTIFAGMFAMVSLSALVMSIVEKDIISVIGCAATGFIAWVMWSVRKDVL